MHSLAELQARFVAALRDPGAPAPAELRAVAGTPAGRRFDIYRNNVHASLVAALAATYPTVARLTGEAFFAAMARAHVAESLPSTPVLLEYGGEFPGFVDRFEPAAGLPYLGDVARLEWARHRAYHAAEADPVDPRPLAALPPARVERVCFAQQRARRCRAPGAQARALAAGDRERLPTGAAVFIDALRGGEALGEAAAGAAVEAADFDLAANLQGLFNSGAVVGYGEAHAPIGGSRS